MEDKRNDIDSYVYHTGGASGRWENRSKTGVKLVYKHEFAPLLIPACSVLRTPTSLKNMNKQYS